MAVLGTGGQIHIHFDAHTIELLTRVGPGEPVWLVQHDGVLTVLITTLELLALVLAPATAWVIEAVLEE